MLESFAGSVKQGKGVMGDEGLDGKCSKGSGSRKPL